MNNSPKKNILTVLGVTVFLSTAAAFAQHGSGNARSTAMADAYGAIARGVESANYNPANLGLRSSPEFSLVFPGIGIGVQNSSFSFGDYKKYNGAYLSDADKQTILNKIPEDGLAVYVNSGVNLLAFSVSRVAFFVSGSAASNMHLSKEFADLLLNGNVFERTYDFSDTRGMALGYASAGMSYGQPLSLPWFDDFAVGTTVRYVRGLAYAEVLSASGSFITDFGGLHGDGNAELKTAQGGAGFAVDLGAAGTIGSNLTLSWSVSNIMSNVKWSEKVKLYRYGVSADSITAQVISDTDADSLIDDFDEETDGSAFSASLPAQMRLAAAYSTKAYLFGVDYIQGFRAAPSVSTTPLLAFGVEYKGLHVLPLRGGIAFGGSGKLVTSLGFGLKLGSFSLNFATQTPRGMFTGTGRGVGLAFDMKIGN